MAHERPKLRGCILALGVLACTLGFFGDAARAAQPLRIVVGGIEKQIYLPAALAERLGYFKEQGLDVELLSDTSGVNAEDELLSGGVEGVVGFYDHTIDLQAKGKFVQSVVQFSLSPGEAEIVSTRDAVTVATPADLKGRVLGVTGLGSSTHLLTLYLAATHGLKAGDFKVVPIGSGVAFSSALRDGRIDAGMTTEPTISRLLKSRDARLLVDLRTPDSTSKLLDGPYPGACLYMKSVWVAAHPAEVQRLVNAFVRALQFIATHSASEIAAALPTDYLLGDRDLYVAALGASKAMFTADGLMPASGPATVLRVMRTVSRHVAGKQIDLARTYTTAFVVNVR